MYRGHIEAKFEAAHKNGPPGHKCAGTLDPELDYHGHSWFAEIEWEYDDDQLDEFGWGPMDFGKAKDLIRALDHHNLNLILDTPSAEVISKYLYTEFSTEFGIAPLFVRLHEGAGNTMTYTDPSND